MMPPTATDFHARLQASLGDGYALERELAGGGMSRVFVAEDRALGRKVVVKVLAPELSGIASAERFRREIHVAARLQHPHIVPLLGAGEAEGGLVYYTMPLVEGESLRDRLRREKQLPIEDAVRIAREVADALEYSHRHGIVHRDVKPENILLEDGHAVVADFGIARALLHASETERLTGTGVTLGTPAYMSPEQASGDKELNGRSDIYSLGCVLYEMLAGDPPFTAATAQAVIARRFKEPVASVRSVRDAVPVALEQAIARALALAPADRFPTARAFADALESQGARTRAIKRAGAGRANRASASRASHLTRRSPERIAAYVALGVMASLVVYASWRWQAASHTPASDRDPRTAMVAARAAEGPSIAVLPFVNMSADPGDEYFSDGMTEELINALTRIEGLRVPARTSSFAFKGKSVSVMAIADSLQVGAVLEGSVRRAGMRLKVTAQLINAADGYHLWSETYERELKDVFAVQDEIARSIVGALRLRLTRRAVGDIARQPTRDLEAYELYLKGRFAWNQRTREALEQAARYFEEAIARDSGFAKAYAGLADIYILLPNYGGVAPTETWAQAKAAALQALALDSTLVDARTTLAYGTMKHDWSWEAAERGFKQAIALDPAYATAHHWYGDFLTGRGRLEESLRELKRAQELDPLSRIVGTDIGRSFLFQRRTGDALAQLRQTVQLDPSFARGRLWLASAYLQAGMRSDAVAQFQASVELSGREPLAVASLAHAYAMAGNARASGPLIAELRERARREYVLPSTLAIAYMGSGDREQALAWLKRAIDTHDPLLAENIFDPRFFDSLSSDSRFTELLRRMGLTP